MADAASAPQPVTAAYVCALERERSAALVSRDIETAARLHAPDYQLITPRGRIFNRAEYLEAIASGTLHYTRWDCGEMQVRLADSMAIVRYRAKLVFASGSSVDCWHTDSYERRGGAWQAVWSQATAIGAP